MRAMYLILACLVSLTASACSLPCHDSPDGCCSDGDCSSDKEDPPPTVESSSVCRVAADCIPASPEPGVIYNCLNGSCQKTPRPCNAGFELDALGQCVKVQTACVPYDDGDPCTDDACDPETGAAVNTSKACDDGNDLTTDSCVPATGDCSHLFDCGNCSDEDPCTTDKCDTQTGCKHEPVVCGSGLVCEAGTCVVHCSENSDCADDNACTIDSCNAESGKCHNQLRDCSDADPTTLDRCVLDCSVAQGYQCESAPTACTGGCDDGDACTTDTCQSGQCAHLTASCGDGTVCSPLSGECIPAPCRGTADCDDGNLCTTESCEFGVCRFRDTQCEVGSVCNAADGQCVVVEHPDCPEGCDDSNPATLDYCEAGICQHTQPVSCGAGTALNPETGECESAVVDPACQEGTRACQQFESTHTIAYAFCAGGMWFVVESCGQIEGSVCLENSGCVRHP